MDLRVCSLVPTSWLFPGSSCRRGEDQWCVWSKLPIQKSYDCELYVHRHWRRDRWTTRCKEKIVQQDNVRLINTVNYMMKFKRILEQIINYIVHVFIIRVQWKNLSFIRHTWSSSTWSFGCVHPGLKISYVRPDWTDQRAQLARALSPNRKGVKACIIAGIHVLTRLEMREPHGDPAPCCWFVDRPCAYDADKALWVVYRGFVMHYLQELFFLIYFFR
jgi:hypothetical protein